MHKVTVQPSGQTFEVQEGEAVLAAALRQGVMLPYGCKNGACGSCKGKILEGSVDYGHYHARVLTEEQAEWWRRNRNREREWFADRRPYAWSLSSSGT